MRIGSRQSSNYFRIYQKNDGVEFELEMKKKSIKLVEKLMFSGNIKKFEEILTTHFYRQFNFSLVQNTCYTNWLLISVRQIFQDRKPNNSLISTYLKTTKLHSTVKKEHSFQLLQFLSFIRNLASSKRSLDENQIYHTISFPLTDLLKFMKVDQKIITRG